MPTHNIPPSKTPTYRQELRALRRQIGSDLHAARVKQKMTLAKLSRLTGIPTAQLDMYELGKGEIGLEEIVKMGRVL